MGKRAEEAKRKRAMNIRESSRVPERHRGEVGITSEEPNDC